MHHLQIRQRRQKCRTLSPAHPANLCPASNPNARKQLGQLRPNVSPDGTSWTSVTPLIMPSIVPSPLPQSLCASAPSLPPSPLGMLSLVRTRRPFPYRRLTPLGAHLLCVAVLCPSLLLVAGCTSSPPVPDGRATPVQQQHDNDLIRQQLDLIPPPSKTRYLAIHSLSAWENPYLTVQGNMVTLHVTLADANTSGLGQGGLLRPAAARQQTLNVALNALPAALNAVPQTSWPYGRVVALEEAHNTPEQARPAVRRSMESVMKSLGDLGIVIYEWQDGGAGIR